MDVLNTLAAGGNRSCRALIACTVLALVVVAPAVAQPFDPDPNSIIRNTQSIESETTFDLFESEYDYALMPSYMGFFEDAGRYYTQLGNIGGEDMFQFMSYRPLGPGYYSFRLQFASDEFETTVGQRFETFVDDATPPTDIFDGVEVTNEFEEIDAWVGYAWPITENGSLGFGLDFNANKGEVEQTQSNVDDNPAPTGDDRNAETTFLQNAESQFITLIGEYMHRGDMSWRVRGYVSDVDNDFENSTVSSETILIDNPDTEGEVSCNGDLRCELNSVSRTNGSFLFGNDLEGGGPAGFNFLQNVAHDGLAYGAEGELRWEKNPKIHHQLNVGIATGDFDAQDDVLEESTSTLTETSVEPADPDTVVTTNIDNHVLTDDDISFDSQFVTWRTRGHFGDTHCGVGLYWFNSETEFDVTANNLLRTIDQEFNDGELVTEVVTDTGDSFFTANHKAQVMTFSIPLALEQDVTDRVQVRLGAQYLRANVNDEFSDIASDPGTTAGALDRESHTLEFDDTFDEVLYHAGLAVEWDRVVLEVLLTSADGGGSDRDGIDLDTAFVGATFKLAARN